MIAEALLINALISGASLRPTTPMQPAPTQSQSPQADRTTGGSPPRHGRRRRKTGMSLWKQFR